MRAAVRVFRTMPASDAPFHPSPGEPTARLDPRVLERPVQQAQVLVSYLGPLLTEPDHAALRVLGTVLGGGMSGRLFTELRDRRGLAYSVGVLGTWRSSRSPEAGGTSRSATAGRWRR